MKFFTCLVPLFWFSTFALGNEERPPWAGFSGQAMVRLAEKTDGGFRVQVLRVNRVWKNNRASKPESLAGQSILVGFRGEEMSVARAGSFRSIKGIDLPLG